MINYLKLQEMDLIRRVQFMVKGYRNFTKNQKQMPVLQGSLQEKNYVITGANSGIGFEAARFAAEKQANVYLVCRNEERGREAVQKIIQLTKNENVFLIVGDMGGKPELEKVYQALQKQIGKIDILVHNAGCMLHKREYTKDGIQKNFATNVFTIYYLTKLCFPLMHEQSRVIITSSGGLYTSKLITEDIFMESEDFNGVTQYSRNKRQQLCIAEEFTKKYKEKGVFLVMHPGWVDTPALREAMPDFYQKMKNSLKAPPEGADTINYLATAPFNTMHSGQFYFDRVVADKHLTISGTKYSQAEANTLMQRLEKLAGL